MMFVLVVVTSLGVATTSMIKGRAACEAAGAAAIAMIKDANQTDTYAEYRCVKGE
jgi:hypothetical protein